MGIELITKKNNLTVSANSGTVEITKPTGETLSDTYNKGYNTGVIEGYGKGEQDGYNTGLTEGVEVGKLALLKDSEYANATESGTVISVNDVSPVEHSLGVKVEGKNLCPNDWEVGMLNTNTGENQWNANYVRTKDYFALDSSKTYYISADGLDSSVGITWYFYDKDKNFIKRIVSYQNRIISVSSTAVPMPEDTVFCRLIVATNDVNIKVQIELGSTATEYTPYVDVTEVEVARYGKNLMDRKPKRNHKAASFSECCFLPKGTYTVSMDFTNATTWRYVYTLYDVNGNQIKENGNHLVAPAELNPSGRAGIFFSEGNGYVYQWDGNRSVGYQVIVIDDDYYLGVSFYYGDITAETVVSNAQIEVGAVKTEYEPCQKQTATANADGTVEGLTSISPSMYLTTNNPNAIITCQYYRDIDGVYEVGRKDNWSEMWDIIQDYGKTQNYYYAFSYDRFTDENYNPKYPIKCSNGTTPARYAFYNAVGITDTKVEIVLNSNNANYMFYGATGLVNIRKLTVYETTELTATFGYCNALAEIRIGGTIGQDVSFVNSSKLTHDSLMSIINALKDYSDTTTTRTLTLHATAKKKLTDADKAKATTKGWTIA